MSAPISVSRPTRLGSGTGRGCSPRQLRLRLWREHLGRGQDGDADLLDPVGGFQVWQATAARLQTWHWEGRVGPRPPGRILPHQVPLAPALKARWVPPLYRVAIDPDGRPRRLRHGGRSSSCPFHP
jgi:hypothetical protein